MQTISDKVHLDRVIEFQANWIEQLQEEQNALEKRCAGIAPLSESRQATIARG
ncbi:hypothetical protein [Burkholderia ubonensis]|uniref:hypothetical protein n=1 Tax=Burkholderia ubonensis TaxID=101571 RepID=UPI000AD735E7|nr:hypothetical protein [Burkholderia ubonensis]